MDNLKNATDIVKEILKENPDARNDDDYLYLKVCERIDGVSISLPFWRVILNRKKYNYPAFETVRRTRQKIQQHHPELSGCSEVEAFRTVNEEKFRNYARQVNV